MTVGVDRRIHCCGVDGGANRRAHRRPVAGTVLWIGVVAIACGACADGGTSRDGRLQIAVVPKGSTHQFWKSIHAGALKGGVEADVEVLWQGPVREDDRQMQIQVVQNFNSRQVDAIVLAPLDSRSLAGPVEAAVGRGIPVVIIDSDLDSDTQAAFIATNNYEGGRTCAYRLAEVIGGRGKVLMLRFMEGHASTTAREQGFLDAIREFAEIEVVSDNQRAGATLETALQASQNLLNRFPEVDGIFAANETSTQGMLRALQTSGRGGASRLVGFDANDTLIAALEDGTIHGLAVQDPFAMGYLGVKAAAAAARQAEYEPYIETRLMMITPENMDESAARELLLPDIATWLGE